jgi:hypothetical protein
LFKRLASVHRTDTQQAGKSAKDELRSFARIADIKCAAIEWFDEGIFDKNAKPLLLDYTIARIGLIAYLEPNGKLPRVVRHRASSNPDSSMVLRSLSRFRSF